MMTSSKDLIERLFTLLDDWRVLPAYQLERRADIFFAIYLDVIIKTRFGDDVEFIIPEFPVRVGDIAENLPELNKSFKIDYVVVCQQKRRVYFVELKTDQGSRRDKQDWYLKRAKEINITKLMDGIIKIYAATGQKRKYDNLIKIFQKLEWLSKDVGSGQNISKDYEIEVVYIQPKNIENDESVICFTMMADYLSSYSDDLTKRFVQSLREWVTNPSDEKIVIDLDKV